MQLALIPPMEFLHDLDKTDYQLCLAHMCENEFYLKSYSRASEHSYLILDNGAAEGAIVTPTELIQTGYQIGADELVIPDYIGNAKVTIDMAKVFRRDYGAVHEAFNLMFVIQGSNRHEVVECIDWAFEQDWITTIGIPRHLIKTFNAPYIRSQFAQYIHRNSPRFIQIHLLGASPLWSTELQEVAQEVGNIVRGMDTSMPYVYGYARRGVDEKPNPQISRQEKYFFNHYDDGQQSNANENVRKMLRWVE